jgi:hypothetical protein
LYFSSKRYHEGVEEQDDQQAEEGYRADEVPGVGRGQEEDHGRGWEGEERDATQFGHEMEDFSLTGEEDSGDDGLHESLLVAGAESDQLAQGGLVGRGQAEQLGVPHVLGGAEDAQCCGQRSTSMQQ